MIREPECDVYATGFITAECDIYGIPEYEEEFQQALVVMCSGCGALYCEVCNEDCPTGEWSR